MEPRITRLLNLSSAASRLEVLVEEQIGGGQFLVRLRLGLGLRGGGRRGRGGRLGGRLRARRGAAHGGEREREAEHFGFHLLFLLGSSVRTVGGGRVASSVPPRVRGPRVESGGRARPARRGRRRAPRRARPSGS